MHSANQIRQFARRIERFGFANPVLISDESEIIAGHGRVAAAKLLGLEKVPCLRLSHLSAEERRAYVLADNKLAENAGWDQEILAIEPQALIRGAIQDCSRRGDLALDLFGACTERLFLQLRDPPN